MAKGTNHKADFGTVKKPVPVQTALNTSDLHFSNCKPSDIAVRMMKPEKYYLACCLKKCEIQIYVMCEKMCITPYTDDDCT